MPKLLVKGAKLTLRGVQSLSKGVAVAVLLFPLTGLNAQRGGVELVIAATTDVHGRLRGWDYYANSVDESRGLSRAATIVDSLRRVARNRVILVDTGDLLQGNPLTYMAARVDSLRASPVIAAMNIMRYDAVAVGNHEFNYGLDHFDKARREARFPFLAANTRRLDDGMPFDGTRIVERSGVKVALIGVTTPGSMVWDRDNLRGRLEVTDIVDALPSQVETARNNGADVVVVLAHAGIHGDASYDTVLTHLPSENPMARVAHEVDGIDAIVIGHSHREIADTSINGVLLVQPRNWATSVALVKLSLERNASGYSITSKRGELVQTAGWTESRAVVRAVEAAHRRAVEYSTTTIGHTQVEWRSDSARLFDTPLIDLIQEVQKKASGAELSMASAFSLKVQIPPGPITVSQIAQLYPYENTLRALRLTGEQIKAYLEHSSRYYVVSLDADGQIVAEPDSRIPGYNFDILSGAEYEIDLSNPVGSRVTKLTYKGQPVAPTDSFTVAVNNYRAGGAGGYDMLRGAPVVFESTTEIRDLLIEEVRRRGSIHPSDVFIDNWRIIQPQRNLRIIAVNDFHGAFVKRPEGRVGNLGGAAEMAAMIRRAQSECLPVCIPVLLHGGDIFQGTPASNMAYGRPVVEIFNALGFVAGALGNHEFDWGQDTLRARMSELRAPILGANVTYADGSDVPWIPDDTLLRLGDMTLGVIGIADPATPNTTMPMHVWDLRFRSPATIIRRRAAELRRRGAEKVVLVAHLGGFCDLGNMDSCRGEIFDLARQVGGDVLDAIVAGHTHVPMSTVVNGVPIVQARSSARAIGVIDIPLSGNAPPRRPEVRAVTSDSITPDPQIAEIVARAEAAVADKVNAHIVDVSENMPRSGNQYALGNLIADAQRAAGRGDVAVMNNGGIRTDLRAGARTWGDLYELQPFENRLVAVTVRGDALRSYLTQLAGGRFHVSGVTIDYDPTARGSNRIRRIIMSDGSQIDNSRRYRVIMTNFLAAGGDGATLSKDAVVEELGIIDLDALISYLQGMSGGRLTVPASLKAPRIRPIS